MINYPKVFIICVSLAIMAGVIVGWTSRDVTAAGKLPILDVRFGQRTVLVSDPNRHTLTLVPGANDAWVCASHDGGKSCKALGDVNAWILRNGEEQ